MGPEVNVRSVARTPVQPLTAAPIFDNQIYLRKRRRGAATDPPRGKRDEIPSAADPLRGRALGAALQLGRPRAFRHPLLLLVPAAADAGLGAGDLRRRPAGEGADHVRTSQRRRGERLRLLFRAGHGARLRRRALEGRRSRPYRANGASAAASSALGSPGSCSAATSIPPIR